jgi:hypothetical protein
VQAYAPKLQSVGGVCRFLHWQKGLGIPPSAAFGKIGDAYVAKVDLWAKAGMVSRCAGSARGKTKEQMARAGGDGRVVLLGIAQERTRIGGRGRPRAKSMWRLRIWSGPGRWALSTTSISRCGPGLGRGVLEDHRLPPWPVYPAECAQLGAAAMRTARHRLHLPGPRVRRLREPRLAAADLRPTRIQRGEKLLWRWHKRVRPVGFPLSFAPDRRWRHVLDN